MESIPTACAKPTMTLTQLRYLIAIADSGLNITTAAERVHATQPGVSKQLKQLEDELGFQLFSRKGKSLHAITASGLQVLERARVIVSEAANIRSIAADLRGEESGDLSIATTHTQARFVLPGPIATLTQRYPGVRFHLKALDDAHVMKVFDRGEADLAIVSTSDSPPDGGVAVPLFTWRRAIVCQRGHALAGLRRRLTLADLARHPLVSYESSLRPESSLRQAFARAGETPQFACTSRDADLIKTYVRAGLGVGIFAEMAMLAEDARDLHVLDAADLFSQCTTWLVLRRDRVPRTYALALIELIAPQLDRRDLHRALTGEIPERWPDPPAWRAAGGATQLAVA
jgi:LysR family transcriptional regulator, cys regulon transcriptional activator